MKHWWVKALVFWACFEIIGCLGGCCRCEKTPEPIKLEITVDVS